MNTDEAMCDISPALISADLCSSLAQLSSFVLSVISVVDHASRMVVGVDRDVFLGQVAGVDRRFGFAQAAAQFRADLGRLQRRADLLRVERDGTAVAEDDGALERERGAVGVEGGAAEAGGADDPAPVRVVA